MRISLPADEAGRQRLEALTSGRAFVKLEPWTIWRVTGADRATFFHNFCTAELKKRASGEGCEGFVLTSQGRILDFVFFTPLGETLWIDGYGDRHEVWNSHFDRYRFTEKVVWHNVGSDTLCLYVSDAAAFDALGIGPDDEGARAYSSRLATFGDAELVVRRVDWLGRVGWTLFVPLRHADAIIDRLASNGFEEATLTEWHRLRALHLTPLVGHDLSEKNLPQEAGRDAMAISYTKGCYLGQETVARLDMMGHVNWKLSLIEGPVPAGDPPPELTVAGKPVARFGTIIERCGSASALAFIRRERAQAGAELATDAGTFVVKRVAGSADSGSPAS
ncbi:MAG TPA: hypothetical protein VGN57_03300 [Pirellulaceae bacterium]|jgi:folate-binding protein YgfZ|nr:hypothetical protein [Pirellulaceae bacterium]